MCIRCVHCVHGFLPLPLPLTMVNILGLLTRPEYHVNIYFNLREQAVLLAIAAVCTTVCFSILNFQKAYGKTNT